MLGVMRANVSEISIRFFLLGKHYSVTFGIKTWAELGISQCLIYVFEQPVIFCFQFNAVASPTSFNSVD